jgi:hypothetical protein
MRNNLFVLFPILRKKWECEYILVGFIILWHIIYVANRFSLIEYQLYPEREQ